MVRSVEGYALGTIVTSAIALVGIYITGALLASWLNEQFATFVSLRTKTLVGGIRNMIGDAASTKVFEHALIVSLGEPIVRSPGARLAMIFAAIGSFFAKAIGVKWLDMPDVVSGRRMPPYISPEHFATVLTDIVRAAAPVSPQSAALANARDDIEAGLAILAADKDLKPLHDVLAPIWRDARGDYDAFVASLAGWFDAHMDRITGWYKRNVQIVLLAIAAVTVAVVNLDSVRMWNELQKNFTLSSALADATVAYYHASASASAAGHTLPTLAPTCGDPTVASTCACPLGFASTSAPTNAPNGSKPQCAIDAATAMKLPIWWSPEQRAALSLRNFPKLEFFQAWVTKLIGLALTVAALMLGAPFWFDLLGAVVNVRTVGAPPSPASPTVTGSTVSGR